MRLFPALLHVPWVFPRNFLQVWSEASARSLAQQDQTDAEASLRRRLAKEGECKMPSFICPKEQVGMRQVMNLSLENSTYLAVFLQWDLQYKTLLPSRKEHLFKYKKYYALKAQCAFTALFSKLHGLKMKTKNWYQSCPILLTPEHDALSCDYKSSQYTFVQTKLYLTASRVLFFSLISQVLSHMHLCLLLFNGSPDLLLCKYVYKQPLMLNFLRNIHHYLR